MSREQPHQNVSNRPFYPKLDTASPVPAARLTFKHLTEGTYRLRVKRTGFRANDAYSAYIEMGSPASLSVSQLGKLHELTRDLPETDRRIKIGPAGEHKLDIPMRSNDVVLVTLTPEPEGR